MQEYTNKELGLMLTNLYEKVTEGFHSTHERLDKTNGKVIANTEWRLKTEGSISTLKWIVSAVGLISVFNAVISFIK